MTLQPGDRVVLYTETASPKPKTTKATSLS